MQEAHEDMTISQRAIFMEQPSPVQEAFTIALKTYTPVANSSLDNSTLGSVVLRKPQACGDREVSIVQMWSSSVLKDGLRAAFVFCRITPFTALR